MFCFTALLRFIERKYSPVFLPGKTISDSKWWLSKLYVFRFVKTHNLCKNKNYFGCQSKNRCVFNKKCQNFSSARLCAHLMAILMALLCYTWIQSVELQAQVSCSNIDRNIHSLIRKPLHIVDFTFDVWLCIRFHHHRIVIIYI